MSNDKLSAVRIVFGVIFSIIFIPVMFAASFTVGNVCTVNNKILDEDAIIDEFKEKDVYNKLIDAAIETVSIDEVDKDIQKRIVTEVFNEACIDEIFTQILDKLFEGEDISLDLEDEFSDGISNAIVKLYDDEAENIIDAWISRDFSKDYEMINAVCGEYIDEQMITFVTTKFGINKSDITQDRVREYLAANSIPETDKKSIIKACRNQVEKHVGEYADKIAKEINSSVADRVDEINDADELNEASEIVMKIKDNATLGIVLCIVAFMICFLILLLIFKAKRAGFVIPAVSLILSAIAYFVEVIVILWATGELTAYVDEAENSIEGLAFELMLDFIDVVKGNILICGTVTFVVAVVMVIAGCVLHAVRKNRIQSLQ